MTFSSSVTTRRVRVERLRHEVEATLDAVQPLLHALDPLVDLVPPLFAAGEARRRGARLLPGGASLLERVVDQGRS